jgi:hypothetical protein
MAGTRTLTVNVRRRRQRSFPSPGFLLSSPPGYKDPVPPRWPFRLSHLAPLFALALAALTFPRPARAFGDQGAFDPRVLLTGSETQAARPDAPPRWSWELVQRTSAPARLRPTLVHADDAALADAPFVYWSGDRAVSPLTSKEVSGLRKYFSLGGLMLVDDAAPTEDGSPGPFGRSARAELARVLSDTTPIAIGEEHVVFRTFYLLRRAEGRVAGKKTLEAIVRGGNARVILSSHDIGGALARGTSGIWEYSVLPGGDAQRERAVRLAVNIAMYALCSNYKDDQVHAPFLMRRRALAPGFEP